MNNENADNKLTNGSPSLGKMTKTNKREKCSHLPIRMSNTDHSASQKPVAASCTEQKWKNFLSKPGQKNKILSFSQKKHTPVEKKYVPLNGINGQIDSFKDSFAKRKVLMTKQRQCREDDRKNLLTKIGGLKRTNEESVEEVTNSSAKTTEFVSSSESFDSFTVKEVVDEDEWTKTNSLPLLDNEKLKEKKFEKRGFYGFPFEDEKKKISKLAAYGSRESLIQSEELFIASENLKGCLKSQKRLRNADGCGELFEKSESRNCFEKNDGPNPVQFCFISSKPIHKNIQTDLSINENFFLAIFPNFSIDMKNFIASQYYHKATEPNVLKYDRSTSPIRETLKECPPDGALCSRTATRAHTKIIQTCQEETCFDIFNPHNTETLCKLNYVQKSNLSMEAIIPFLNHIYAKRASYSNNILLETLENFLLYEKVKRLEQELVQADTKRRSYEEDVKLTCKQFAQSIDSWIDVFDSTVHHVSDNVMRKTEKLKAVVDSQVKNLESKRVELFFGELRNLVQESNKEMTTKIHQFEEMCNQKVFKLETRLMTLKERFVDIKRKNRFKSGCNHNGISNLLTKDPKNMTRETLEMEVLSLQTALQLKIDELNILRAKYNEAVNKTKQLRDLNERLQVSEQRNEDLKALLELRHDYEKAMQAKHARLMQRFDRETKEKRRLTLQNEELAFKLSNNLQVLKSKCDS